MQSTWLVILPPLLVLLISFTTHRIMLSLLVGILAAAGISHNFNPIATITSAISRLWEQLEFSNLASWHLFWNKSENLFIFIFLILLGVLIVMINKTGGSQAYVSYIKKKLKTKRDAESASFLLTILFFIDEYLNILTVGSVMHPVTDTFKIPRAKLAYIINAMASSLCIVVPLSSWGAFIIIQLYQSGVSLEKTATTIVQTTPLDLFIHIIPFTFYSFVIIIGTLFIIRKRISFGAMRKHETIAEKTGNLYGGKQAPKKATTTIVCNGCTMIDFLFPIGILSGAVLTSLYFTNFDAPPALFLGSVIAIISSTIFFIIRGKLSVKMLPSFVYDGAKIMLPTLLVITLAWTFGSILKNDLHTGQFLASQFIGHISISLIPLLFFITTIATTMTIGSAWGSMAIMIPIATQMVASLMQWPSAIPIDHAFLLFPTLGAILSGSVAGSQLTPISDIVIMASTSTGAHHMDHVKTMRHYVIPMIIGTGVSFLLSGILRELAGYINIFVSMSVGIGITLSILWWLDRGE